MADLPKYHGPRVKLELGKFRVLRITRALVGFDIHVDFHGKVLIISAPLQVDVHEGDLMYLYTEVPIAQPK